jgi:hypothetical protein
VGQEGPGAQVASVHFPEIRAMDRRRFAPSAEALEGKALLSLFGVTSKNTTQQISVVDLPETFRQKELRIEHLPFYLEQTQPGRFLPAATITQLQSDLGDIAARLHAPTTQVVDAFNHGLQHALPYLTLSASNAHLLNASFGSVLDRAGATPQETANLRQDMNQIAFVDSKSIEPSWVVRNDSSLVPQPALFPLTCRSRPRGRRRWRPTMGSRPRTASPGSPTTTCRRSSEATRRARRGSAS